MLARVTNLPITGLEIAAGIVLVGTFGFGLLFFLVEWVHVPFLIGVVGATALADTSISIVYATLHQYEIANLPFGRLILASTLMVNLLEDVTITLATFLTSPMVVYTAGILAALAIGAVLLPRLGHWMEERFSPTFSNISTRVVLLSLAVLATLASLVNVPGILFVPFYFMAVGLKVDVGFVLANLPLLLALVGVATALKVAGILPSPRKAFGPAIAPSVAILMNTRLTSATVILLLTVTLGIITVQWYSLFVSSVVILALGSSLVLRTFPAFRSAPAARMAFESIPTGSVPSGGT